DTVGFNGGSLLVQGSLLLYLTQQTDKALWDPVTRQLFLIGQGDGSAGWATTGAFFIKYGEACNCWTSLSLANIGPPAHGYNHMSINSAAGKIYYRVYAKPAIWEYDIAKNTWSVLTNVPSTTYNTVTTLEYFPEAGGIVYLDGDFGLYFFKLSTRQWQKLADTNKGGVYIMGSFENTIRYN